MICRAFFGHDSKYVLRERSARTAYATSVERPAVGGWLANKEYKDVTCIQSFFGRMRLKENSGKTKTACEVLSGAAKLPHAVSILSKRSSGAAKLPHAVSNTSKEKLKGYMKGAMMRALDSSSSDLMLFASLQGIFLETSSLCYPRTLFRHALLELAEKYRIFSQYTQIVKLWENSKQHTEWVALQRKARVFSADERCFGNSSR